MALESPPPLDAESVKDLISNAIGRTWAELAALSRAGMVTVVAALAAVKAVLSWQADELSGLQALVAIATLMLYEVAVVRDVRDFERLEFALLLMLPIAVWVGLQIVGSLGARERRRAWVRADMRRYQAALRRDPSNVAAHVLLGDSYLKLGQKVRAEREYQAALTLDPAEYEARHKLQRVRAL